MITKKSSPGRGYSTNKTAGQNFTAVLTGLSTDPLAGRFDKDRNNAIHTEGVAP